MKTTELVEKIKSLGRTRLSNRDETHASRYRKERTYRQGRMSGRYEPKPENRVAEDDEPRKSKDVVDTEPKIMSFVGQSR